MVRTSYSASALVPVGLVTSGDGDTVSSTTNQWQGLSNVTSSGDSTLKSDQLTISYIAPATMMNCVGNTVNAGDYVIERYFLRYDTVGPKTTSGIKNLVLACDAGSIISGLDYLVTTTPPPTGSVAASNSTTNPITPSVVCGTFTTPAIYSATNPAQVTTIANPSAGCATAFGGGGQVLMSRVDYLHFLLGTIAQDGTGNMAYYTINGYKKLSNPKPQIVSIQMAVLVRSLDNTGNPLINPTQTYSMFGQTVTPVAASEGAAPNHFARQVYETTVALRNAMGSSS